jgi:hypothetical protein
VTPLLEDEKHAVAWAIQNPTQFWSLADRMGEQVFQRRPWDVLWPLLVKAWVKHDSFPSVEEIPALLQPLEADGSTKMVYVSLLRSLYTLDVSAFTGGEVADWIGYKELDRLISVLQDNRASKHSLSSQLQFAKERIEKIEGLSGKKEFGKVFNPDDDLLNWRDKIEEEYGTKPVTTGIHRLDSKLRDYGLRNILALLVGPTGGFKTTVALHMGWGNLRKKRAIHPDGFWLGGRVVHFFTDDNQGEISQRRVAHLIQRALKLSDYEDGQHQRVGKLAAARADEEYPGTLRYVEIDPEQYTPKDFFRHFQDLQAMYAAEDKALIREGWLIEPQDIGRINLGVIDIADHVKSVGSSKEDWRREELKFGELSIIPKKLKFPLICTVQGNQSLVGASQGTLRNVGGSYGKVKAAKLVMTVVQTAAQSQNLKTIQAASPAVVNNLHHMWAYNPSSDRNTEWEAFGICLNKNTYGNGEGGVGLVRNVMIPMLGHLASCRITEDYSQADELLRTPGQTAVEEKTAAGELPPARSGKKGPK